MAKINLDPCNADRAMWAASAMANFARISDREADLQTDPETLLGDLLTDLMHWCDIEKRHKSSVEFESALEQARLHFVAERVQE